MFSIKITIDTVPKEDCNPLLTWQLLDNKEKKHLIPLFTVSVVSKN
jgi:hypothetical protein